MQKRHHSEESKKKISIALKGRTFSKETREKMSKAKLGEKNPRTYLTEEIVRNIKLDARNKFNTQKILALKYNISYKTIDHIIRNRSWKHIKVL